MQKTTRGTRKWISVRMAAVFWEKVIFCVSICMTDCVTISMQRFCCQERAVQRRRFRFSQRDLGM